MPLQRPAATPLLTTSTDLDAHLAPGEVVLWRAKPERREFVYRTWPLSVFGGVLVVALVAYEAVVLTTEAPDWLAVIGVPFALAALYMVVGHFWVTGREWANTEYLVSERQVLIRHGIFEPRVTHFSLHGLPHTLVEMRRTPDVGNVLFKPREGEGYGPYPGYATMWPYTPDYIVGFLCVRHPARVQSIIEGARQGRRP